MYVSLDRQNPHLAFKTLQNWYIWAPYDTLEKTIIRSEFCKKSFSQEEKLANASSIARCFVCPRFNATYISRQAIYVQLRIAHCHVIALLCAS